MAWVTTLGPAAGQVDYRLVEGSGCGLAYQTQAGEPALGEGEGLDPGEARELEAAADRAVVYRMQDRHERALTWIGQGLAEVGLAAGTDLVSEADRETARALMAGIDPRTGETLLKPKVAADPRGRIPAAVYVTALRNAADARGVTVGALTKNVKAAERIGQLVRGVAREGGSHYAPIKDLTAVAKATGVALEGAYEAHVLEQALEFSGKTVRIGNRGYDVTLDLPKSVSVLYGISAPAMSQRVEDTFAGVVAETVTALEEWASYGMTGKNGKGKVATRIESSGLLGWVMWHAVARPVDGQVPDPHLHAHAVIANLVKCEDGRWYAPGNGGRELHRHVQAAGALTQARMRRELTNTYGIAWERDEKTGAWEIAAIGRDIRTLLSKRASQVTAKLIEEGLDPETATRAQAKTASAKSRESKSEQGPAGKQEVGEGPRGLRTLWHEQLTAHGIDAETLAASVERPGHGAEPDLPTETIAEQIFDPEQGLTAHRKRIGRADIITAVCDTMPSGVASLNHAQDLVDQVIKLPDCPVVMLVRGPAYLTHNDRYTTPDILSAELSGLDSARTGYDGQLAVLPAEAAEHALAAFGRARGFELSAEQRQVAVRLMTGGHGVDAVIGVAGSGKTVLMAAVRQAYAAAGKSVHGAATAAVAAAGLAAETGIPSATVATWMRRIKGGQGLTGGDVLVVDEAAMVDDRELAALLEAARTSGTKVIMIGDPLQLKAVGVGGLFAGIHRQVGGLTMYENRRQRDPLQRRALELWRDGRRDEALREWGRGGHVHAGLDPAETMAALLTDWAATRTGMYTPGTSGGWMDVHEELGRLLVLAGTNTDVDELNAAARALRRQRGEITGEDRHYQREDGTSIALAVGDHVRVRQNDYRTRKADAAEDAVDVLNGYRGHITQIDDDGRVLVEWRRQTPGGLTLEQQWLTPGYISAGGLTHGTAMTVASAQGMTADVALVYGRGLDPNSLYSAMSRARDRTELYLPLGTLETDADRAQLGEIHNGDDALARTLAAYGRTLTGGPDDLVVTELGLEPDPIAPQQQPQPVPKLQDLQELPQFRRIGRAAAARLRSATTQDQRPEPAVEQTAQPQPDPAAGQRAARTTANAPGLEGDRADGDGQEREIPHWTHRPYGHHLAEDLARMAHDADQTHQDLTLQAQQPLTDAQLALIGARGGTGPNLQVLETRRQNLEAAQQAGVLARSLEAEHRAAYADNHTALTQVRDLQEQKARNPLYLMVVKRTTRGTLGAQIDELNAEIAERTRRAKELEQPAAEARHAARHPDPLHTRGRRDDDYNDRQVIADLRHLRENWHDLRTTALGSDITAADQALATAQAAATPLHASAGQHLGQVEAIATELDLRQALPDDQATTEDTERAAHLAEQAEQARVEAEARRERLAGPDRNHHYRHDPGGPSRGQGWSR